MTATCSACGVREATVISTEPSATRRGRTNRHPYCRRCAAATVRIAAGAGVKITLRRLASN